jgi:UDP-N-acetylmuramyl pentapeptide phosphotransferase/UDP-N-acetylglucosamine-1-phosphate transferase
MQYLVAVVISFLIVFLLMPSIIKVANRYEFTDKPTERKKHRGPIPLCGGVAIYIGFFVVYFLIVDENLLLKFWVFLGATLIVLIGLVDDGFKAKGREFPIFPRLIIQILAAIIVFQGGVAFQGFNNPLTGGYVLLPLPVQFILTITWIFGVTTVINWSDGMDGLAGGISTVSSLTFFFAALILGQNISAMNSIALAGAIFAFFLYNKYPAKVFMGDSGANVIGFLLSIIALDGAFKQATVLTLFIPILALAVPIFDNIFVIFKRFSEGKPVYQADRSQMHYRLQEKGLSTKQIVNFILGISFICSTLSIVLLLIRH